MLYCDIPAIEQNLGQPYKCVKRPSFFNDYKWLGVIHITIKIKRTGPRCEPCGTPQKLLLSQGILDRVKKFQSERKQQKNRVVTDQWSVTVM